MTQLAVAPQAERVQAAFDLLVTVDYWTADLALKLMPETNGPRVEIYHGSMIVSRHAGFDHQVVETNLTNLLRQAARGANLWVYAEVNIVDGVHLFIPDIAVLRRSAAGQTFAPIADAEMLVEIVSRNRKKDVIDRPREYAAAGVPWFIRVDLHGRQAGIVQHKLIDGAYEPVAAAPAGTVFAMKEPFEFSIDPADLLDDE